MTSTHQRGAAVALALLTTVSACRSREQPHEHADEHPAGHDHHEAGHGHGDLPVVRVTRWSAKLELFAEHPVAVAGQELSWLVHLTVLQDFRALEGAPVRLELAGAAPITASASAAVRPGIYALTFVAPPPGTYRGRLVVGGPVDDAVEGLELEVFADAEAARGAGHEHEEGRYIELLKEQQWGVRFATAFAERGTLTPSIEVAGTVTTPPGGSAEVSAPVPGRLIAPPQGLPRPGATVRKGQLLATLAPSPSSPEDAVRAGLAISEATAHLERSRAALARAERLLGDHAISQRDVDDARREAGVAEESLRAARGVDALYAGAARGSGPGTWRLVSPIEGTLVEVAATPGATVGPGTVLFRLVDARELWLRARVPEQDAAHLREDRAPSYQIAGVEDFVSLPLVGDAATASLVTIGRTVDRTSRTVEVIYALRAPEPRLRVGGLVRLGVPAGPDFTGVLVPRGALVDDGGRDVVYVQIDGEHFEERVVRVGARQGGRVGIDAGLAEGERVVVDGAHIVRLAGRATSAQPHGHIH